MRRQVGMDEAKMTLFCFLEKKYDELKNYYNNRVRSISTTVTFQESRDLMG